MQKHGPLSVALACDYIRQAALGLQFAADHGMVHRDIKPHNLMLTPDGRVKILDFGLARLVREEVADIDRKLAEAEPIPARDSETVAPLTDAGTLMGTADFLAPEQAADPRQADIRADIYSLGCTLHYLLAGSVPYPGGTAQDKLVAHRDKKPEPLGNKRADVPAALANVLERMMAKDPAERYQTPAQAAEALRPFTTAGSAMRRRVKRLIVAGAALAACLLAGAIVYVQTDKGEFVIETDSDRVAVLVNGQGLKIRDNDSNREYQLKIGRHNIRAGEYKIDVKELPEGVDFSTDSFTLKRGSHQAVRVTFNTKKDPKYLKEDALGWFPPGATFLGAGNMEVFPELWQAQLLLFKEMNGNRTRWANEKGDRFGRFMDHIGQIERFSFAYARNRQDPARSTMVLRFTGSIKHNRLVDFFQREWTGLTIEQSASMGAPVTVIYDSQPGSKFGNAVALIGTTDLIIASYATEDPTAQHIEVIRNCLELRAGRGVSLPVAQAKELEEIPANSWGYGLGEPPAFAKGQVPFLAWMARSCMASLAGTTDLQASFRGTFATEAEAKLLPPILEALFQGILKAPRLAKNPELAAAAANAFRSLKVEVEGKSVRFRIVVPSVAFAAMIEWIQDIPIKDIHAPPAFLDPAKLK